MYVVGYSVISRQLNPLPKEVVRHTLVVIYLNVREVFFLLK